MFFVLIIFFAYQPRRRRPRVRRPWRAQACPVAVIAVIGLQEAAVEEVGQVRAHRRRGR